MDASDRLLEFRRTGGRAAIDDYLVVDRDGHAMLGRELEIKDW
jgi:hypothetical protein